MAKANKTRHRIRFGAVRRIATDAYGQTVGCSCGEYTGDEVIRRTKAAAIVGARVAHETHAAMARTGGSALDVTLGRIFRPV